MSEPDLLHHYKVLKQFLDILEDSATRAKSNSSRALRAREKLLKLLSAQFRELSTDVYDELKRRIDESRAEPDFLLPKLTFHPKRNQARQKLSLLPQTRFRDLVMDISYEISRRNLHIPAASTVSQAESPSYKQHQKTPSSYSHSHSHSQQSQPQIHASPQKPKHSNNEPLDLNRVDDADISHLTVDEAPHANSTSRNLDANDLQLSNADTSKQTIAVQPTTVVPTKANLTWSSDEEEEDEKPSFGQSETSRSLAPAAGAGAAGAVAGAAASSMLSNGNANTKEIEELKQALQAAEARALELQRANEDLKSNLAATLSEKDSLEAQHRLLVQKSSNTADPNELNALRAELESLKQSSAALRLENQALKNKHWKDSRHQSRDLSKEESFAGNSLPGRFNSRPSSASSNQALDFASRSPPSKSLPKGSSAALADVDVNKQLQILHEKMSAIDKPQNVTSASRRELLLRTEASKWQQRFQDAQAGIIKRNLLANKPQLDQYVSPTGLISLESATSFYAAIETFLIGLYENTPDTELLFERISNVAFQANSLASAADHSAMYENGHLAINVREAASHSLTATRYFGSNARLLPRVVVERSVDELAFTVCELISTFKLNDGSTPQQQEIVSKAANVPESNDMIRPLRIGKATNLSPPNRKQDPSREMSPVEDFSTPRLRSMSIDALQPPRNEITDSPSPAKVLPGSLPLNDSEQDVNIPKVQPAKKLTMFERLSGKKAPTDDDSTTKVLNVKNGSTPETPSQPSVKPEATSSAKAVTDAEPNKTKAIGSTLAAGAAAGATAIAAATSTQEKEPKSNSLTEANTNSPSDLTSEKVKPLETKTKEANHPQNKENVAPSTPQSASRANILDKVRQFESPEGSATKSLASKTKSPTLNSIKTAKEMLSKEASPQQNSSGAKSNDNTPTRSRSLFQTLRNRFAGDNTEAKTEENKNESENAADDKQKSTNTEAQTKEVQDSPAVKSKNETEASTSSELADPTSPLAKATAAASHYSLKKGAAGAVAGAGAYVGAEKTVEALNENETDEQSKPEEKREAISKEIENDANSSKIEEAKTEQGLNSKPSLKSLSGRSSSFKVRKVSHSGEKEPVKEPEEEEESDYDDEEEEARQRQEYRKSMAAATFNFDLFDIDDPDNTLTQVLLYLEHQTVQVISTIQDLLTAIKKPDATRGELRENSKAISEVIKQMSDATKTSMNQTRNHQLKEHGSWVVTSLEDCNHRMNALCRPNADKSDDEFADKNFKQRLAGISFDIAKCTKELVKTVEEASLKEDIAHLDARLNQPDDDLT